MNELKGRHGLKQESLIHFHVASLHTVFPFGKSQALSTNLWDYLTSAGRSWGPPLFYNLQRWSDKTVVDDYYYRWMILRALMRSCLHGVCVSGELVEWVVDESACLKLVDFDGMLGFSIRC